MAKWTNTRPLRPQRWRCWLRVFWGVGHCSCWLRQTSFLPEAAATTAAADEVGLIQVRAVMVVAGWVAVPFLAVVQESLPKGADSTSRHDPNSDHRMAPSQRAVSYGHVVSRMPDWRADQRKALFGSQGHALSRPSASYPFLNRILAGLPR